MSNYLSIASEDDFEVGSGSIVYPLISGFAIFILLELYLTGRTTSPDASNDVANKKDRKKERESDKLRQIFWICVVAILFCQCASNLCNSLCSQISSYTNQARIQNATIVVRSLEAYRAESQEKRDQIAKKLNENVSNDPLTKVELEAELRVEERNLAYVEEQLKQAKLKKESLELYISTIQDRTLFSEYRKLRTDNAEMSKVLNEMKSDIQALKDLLSGLKKGNDQSKIYQIEKRDLATATK